jgi:hypothetical protein
VRKVEEPGGVQRRVGGVWRQGEREAARDEAVEGGVQVAGERCQLCAQRQSGQADAPCCRIDFARERHRQRFGVLFSLCRRRAFASFQHHGSEGRRDRGATEGGTRRINIGSE